MSSIFEEIGGLTGGVAAEGLAFAAGFAAARALGPAAATIEQDAWNAAPVRRIPDTLAAEIAAENIAAYNTMQSEATYSGWDASRFAYLYHLNLVAPGTGELLTMLRHGTINPGNFTHGLRKNKLEPMWDAAIAELQTQRLDPAQLALGVVRSTVKDPGLLVVTLDTEGSTIPPYPQWPGDTLAEFLAGGVDKDRARVLVGSVGLPMSPQQAASAAFRKIINRQAFNLSILEGDIRPEYADAIYEQARQIPTVGEMMEHSLRGFESLASAKTNAERHGMLAQDAQLVYDNLGRAPGLHAVTTALARGGDYDGTPQTIPEPYLSAVQRANIRPEWYDLEYANRYTYPSGFQIKSEAPVMGEALTEQTLLEVGWKPELAKFFATHWANPTASASTASSHASKAATQLWNTTHNSYKAGEIPQTTAAANLTTLGVSPTEQTEVFGYWNAERDTIRKSLSASQIKKAYTSQTTNPDTGVAWTLQEAIDRLLALGYDQADATTLLEE